MRRGNGQQASGNRKILRLAVCAVLLAFYAVSEAQQPQKIPRIGYLTSVSAATDAGRSAAFRHGLSELGYVPGKNIAIEYRYAEGSFQRLPELAEELIGLKPEAIVVSSLQGVLAAKNATRTIPIVMTNVGDPVGEGVIVSLARPGGNITGLTGVAPDLSGKRLELLKETIPKLARVGVLWDPRMHTIAILFNETEVAAKRLAVEIRSLQVRQAEDFDDVFKTASEARAGALAVLQNPSSLRIEKKLSSLRQINACRRCSARARMWSRAASCRTARATMIYSGEPPGMWTGFSKVRSRRTCPSNSPRSSSWSSI